MIEKLIQLLNAGDETAITEFIIANKKELANEISSKLETKADLQSIKDSLAGDEPEPEETFEEIVDSEFAEKESE